MAFTRKHTTSKNASRLQRVAIGIQARSTSQRFPEKVFADLCGKPLLQWVIDAAKESANYISRPNLSRSIDTQVYLLVPEGDKIVGAFNRACPIIQGSEFDVLSRYAELLRFSEADYVVRITGDCPLIPPPVITKAINVAVINGYDYVSNVDERLRLAFDGMDCEVISARLLRYVAEKAFLQSDREHVTTFIRREKLPPEFTSAHIIGYLDLSGMKLSVDTEADLAEVRKQKQRVLNALKQSEELLGEKACHRF